MYDLKMKPEFRFAAHLSTFIGSWDIRAIGPPPLSLP